LWRKREGIEDYPKNIRSLIPQLHAGAENFGPLGFTCSRSWFRETSSQTPEMVEAGKKVGYNPVVDLWSKM
jgi:hypothetical protein